MRRIMHIMNFNIMSDQAVLRELGQRLTQARLAKNLTQATLSRMTGVGRRTIQKIEDGEVATLKSFIAVLRGLGQLDQLDLFLPAQPFSPIELAKLKGRQRRRASGAGRKPKPRKETATDQVRERPDQDGDTPWQWGE